MAFKKSFLIPLNIKLELSFELRPVPFSLRYLGFVRDKSGL